MAEVSKEEVQFIKEVVILLRNLMPYLQNSKTFEIKIGFDEKNALPVVTVKREKHEQH